MDTTPWQMASILKQTAFSSKCADGPKDGSVPKKIDLACTFPHVAYIADISRLYKSKPTMMNSGGGCA